MSARQTYIRYLVLISIVIVAVALSLSGQSPEDAQRLVTGQITDINVSKHILTVRPGPIDEAPRRPEPGTNRGGRGGTRGGGGGRRGGGTGIPIPGSGGGGRTPVPSSKNQAKTFKVTVTDQTVIKDNVTTISFGMIRVQDHVTIRGLPIKGKNEDLTATEIVVNN
jgi:hypothetical protein